MKKVLIILAAISMFAVTGCTKSAKSPEAHCSEVMEHTMKILMNGPAIKKLPKEKLDKMKESFAKNKAEGVKKCVAEYDKKALDCMLKANTMKEAAPCMEEAKKRNKAKKKTVKKEKKVAVKKVEVKADAKKVEVKADAKKVEVKADAKKVEVKADAKKVEVKTK